MRLFQRRRHEANRALGAQKLAEAIPAEARAKIGHALSDHALPARDLARFGYGVNVTDWMVLNDHLTWVLVRAWGVVRLQSDDVRDVLPRATDGEVLDVVEAWFQATARLAQELDASSGVIYVEGSPIARTATETGERFRERINDIFDEHDVAWQLVGHEIIPRSSVAMHATVVAPVFALTQGEPRLAAVESSYKDALRELKPDGNPTDAITDAARALQEMLVVAGARGDSLGRLLVDARKRELISPYDSKLADAFELLGDWVSADRSARGDAHHVHEASREDAWLAVRVAGALILRLGAGRRR